MRHSLHSRVLATAALCVAAAAARGQEPTRRSQLGVVTQYVAGAKLEVLYRRPVARGRTLFGGLVPFGKIWTPSADSAARFSTSAPITVNGAHLAAGSYSVWAIPDSVSWTLVFNGMPAVFHLSYPSGHDVLRVKATPTHGEHVESLEFSFPMIDADSARLELRWGSTVVPLSIKATP